MDEDELLFLLAAYTGGAGGIFSIDPTTLTNIVDIWDMSPGSITTDTSSGQTRAQKLTGITNGNGFTQSTVGQMTIYLNGGAGTQNKPFIRADGIGNYMTSAIVPGANYTIIAVTANNRTSQNNKVDVVINAQQNSGGFNGPEFDSFNYFINNTQRQVTAGCNGATIVTYKNGLTSPVTLNVNEWAVIAATFSGATTASIPWSLFTDKALALFAQIDLAYLLITSDVKTPTQVLGVSNFLKTSIGI